MTARESHCQRKIGYELPHLVPLSAALSACGSWTGLVINDTVDLYQLMKTDPNQKDAQTCDLYQSTSTDPLKNMDGSVIRHGESRYAD